MNTGPNKCFDPSVFHPCFIRDWFSQIHRKFTSNVGAGSSSFARNALSMGRNGIIFKVGRASPSLAGTPSTFTLYSGPAFSLPFKSIVQPLTMSGLSDFGNGVSPADSGAGELRTFGSAASAASLASAVRTSTRQFAGDPLTETTANCQHVTGSSLAVAGWAATLICAGAMLQLRSDSLPVTKFTAV